MNVEQLLTEINTLDENALEQLKKQIARREDTLRAQQHPPIVDEWNVMLSQFLDDFWADTPAEEQNNVIEAIRIKNRPPSRDV